MTGILNKYKESGSFTFYQHDNLKLACNAPTTKSGIYLFYAFDVKNNKSLVYIGCSGHIKTDGSIAVRKTGMGGIKGRIVNGHQFGKTKRFESLPLQMKIDGFEYLEIYWFVTFNEIHKDSPIFVESTLLQFHYNENGKLPKWNKKF